MTKSETKISKDIQDMIEAEFKGLIYLDRCQSGTVKKGKFFIKCAAAGTADRIGLIKGGRFLAMEAKTPEGAKKKSPTSEAQEKYGEMIREMGGVYLRAESVEQAREAITKALLDKCSTCTHKGAVYDIVCSDCRWFYGSKYDGVKGE